MNWVKARFVTVVVFLTLISFQCFAFQAAVELSQATLAERIVALSNPVYPPIAKKTGLQGKVVLKVTINSEGKVAQVNVISGHPMLVSSAMEAVRKWEYSPLVINGNRVSVTGIVEVPFKLMPDVDYAKQELFSQDYFKKSDRCRDLIKNQNFVEAESVCKSAVEIAEKLPDTRSLERLGAYQLAGHSLYLQRKFQDALPFYKHELDIAEKTLEQHNSEFAYALRDVARALHGSGDFETSRIYYERAQASLILARDHIESEFLKNEYSKALRRILFEYAALLRQSGNHAGSDAAEKKAQGIVIKSGLKDN
jgi:TonB family protein